MSETPQLTLMNGGQPSFDAEVGRLLEEPDGAAAWVELKRLARRFRPAANSALADVSASCQEAQHTDPHLPDIHE
jgi:hypothetical protein